jgi:hypothetical protein
MRDVVDVHPGEGRLLEIARALPRSTSGDIVEPHDIARRQWRLPRARVCTGNVIVVETVAQKARDRSRRSGIGGKRVFRSERVRLAVGMGKLALNARFGALDVVHGHDRNGWFGAIERG